MMQATTSGVQAMRRQFCDTHMGQVHVVTAGEGPATPLLLLHQTPRSIHEFAEVIPLLAKSRRAIAVDMPGHGYSDPVPGQLTIEHYARAPSGARHPRRGPRRRRPPHGRRDRRRARRSRPGADRARGDVGAGVRGFTVATHPGNAAASGGDAGPGVKRQRQVFGRQPRRTSQIGNAICTITSNASGSAGRRGVFSSTATLVSWGS